MVFIEQAYAQAGGGGFAPQFLWGKHTGNDYPGIKVFLIYNTLQCRPEGLSTYFLISAIVSQPKQNIKIDRISSPQPMYEPSEDLYDETIPDDIYEGMQQYKRYMDSTGEAIRPGLADSMRVLEEMYLQQRKK